MGKSSSRKSTKTKGQYSITTNERYIEEILSGFRDFSEGKIFA